MEFLLLLYCVAFGPAQFGLYTILPPALAQWATPETRSDPAPNWGPASRFSSNAGSDGPDARAPWSPPGAAAVGRKFVHFGANIGTESFFERRDFEAHCVFVDRAKLGPDFMYEREQLGEEP